MQNVGTNNIVGIVKIKTLPVTKLLSCKKNIIYNNSNDWKSEHISPRHFWKCFQNDSRKNS